MKLLNGPKVYLLGKQVVQQDELTRFLVDHDFANWTTDSPSDAETLVELAARNCYQSFKGGRPHADHLKHLLEVGHGSTLEHAVWNLLIVGVSRSLSHELIRHRAGVGISQLSQRYVDESVAEYVVPPDLQLEVDCYLYMEAVSFHGDEPASMTEAEADAKWPHVAAMHIDDYCRASDVGELWVKSVRQSHENYKKIAEYLTEKAQRPVKCMKCNGVGYFTRVMETTGGSAWSICQKCWNKGEVPLCSDKTSARKYARQAARSVLPNATETKIFVTANARALRNIVEQRGSRHADPEIRVLANRIYDVMKAEAPNLFGDYQCVPLADGTFEIETEWRKV